jgi:dUTP pyrophosphatase
MEKVIVKIKRASNLFNDIELPAYKTLGSSGADLRAAIEDCIVIKPGEIKIIPTNLIVEIPLGYEIQIRPRSGLAAEYGIGLVNSPGTIDSDYRGEIKVIMINFGSRPFEIKRGDRIAQMVLSKTYKIEFVETENIENTERGEGGFGHTGIK